jgi:tocopherol O-methyltransferase
LVAAVLAEFSLLWTVGADVTTGPHAGIGEPALNQAVEEYYDTTLTLYEELWGEHVHHGYWDPGESPRSTGADRHAACDRTVRELIAFAELPTGSHILDVGCGIGGPAIHLARGHGCRVEGITLSSLQAGRATDKAALAGVADRTRFRQVDMLANDFGDESFDAVWALESVMHMPNRAAFFAEAWRVLRPGGTLALSSWCIRDDDLDVAEEHLLSLILRHQVMPRLMSIEEHAKLCWDAGFCEVRTRDWSEAVRHSWDPDFAMIRQLDNGREYVRDLARAKGVDVLGFFYAGPLMKQAYDRDVMRYGVLRATKPPST